MVAGGLGDFIPVTVIQPTGINRDRCYPVSSSLSPRRYVPMGVRKSWIEGTFPCAGCFSGATREPRCAGSAGTSERLSLAGSLL
jgi:hypothetical protein